MISGDEDNPCALLTDEQLCVVVERDLVAVAETYRQPHHASAKDGASRAGGGGSTARVAAAIAEAVAVHHADSPVKARSLQRASPVGDP